MRKFTGQKCHPAGLQTVESCRQTQEPRSPFVQPLQIPERKIPVSSMPAQKGWIGELFCLLINLHNTDSHKLFCIIWQKNSHHACSPYHSADLNRQDLWRPAVLDCRASHFCNLASPEVSSWMPMILWEIGGSLDLKTFASRLLLHVDLWWHVEHSKLKRDAI